MDNSNCDNPRATENINPSDDIDLNDLLCTFHDDPNNEVKSFTCSRYIEIESLFYRDIKQFLCTQPEYLKC